MLPCAGQPARAVFERAVVAAKVVEQALGYNNGSVAGGMMQFSFTPEQEELRSVLRRFLERQCPMDRVRAAMAGDSGR